jgi:hypothetical protein
MQQQPQRFDEGINQPKLREYIAAYFDLEELKLLCFDLDIDYENIVGDTKAGKTMALVSYCARRGELWDLVQKCGEKRPRVDWNAVTTTAESSPMALSDDERERAIDKLKELKTLLDESWATFVTQGQQRNRLSDMLLSNHPIPSHKGYNDLFYQLHDDMNQEEKELFQIIRGTTMGSVYRVNEKLRKWADDNPVYRLLPKSTPSRDRLEEELLQLKVHFGSWFSKYELVFLKDERQSLVYLADERRQGIGFPKQLGSVVDQTISELEAYPD